MNWLRRRLIFSAQFAEDSKSRLRGSCVCLFVCFNLGVYWISERRIMALQREDCLRSRETLILTATLFSVDSREL